MNWPVCLKGEKTGMKKKPLDGITILDMSWVIAGPHANRLLADLGATVIKLESSTRIDPIRLDTARTGITDFSKEGGYAFQDNSRDKLGLCLNLKSPSGNAILEKLIAKVDIVTCNFAPKGFHKMGLDFEHLSKIKKDIIVVNASGLGDSGPFSSYATFAPILQCLTGITSLIGYDGEEPYGFPALLADYLGGISLAAAAVGALEYRRRTGCGQFVDLSQAESAIGCIGPMLLDYQINGSKAVPVGNHHYTKQMAPHNCYPCLEENTWCVIAVACEEDWIRFSKALADTCPELANDQFDTLQGRLTHQAELDVIISRWTQMHTPAQVAGYLQAMGVSAGPVENTIDSLQDENLIARKYFTPLTFEEDDAILPKRIQITDQIIHMASVAPHPHSPAPRMGEHNNRILKEMLSLSDEEIAAAQADNAFI
jgi:crotonobetainyl-CoA:carnitine CoA-transferase CaiB-like acyl-CoA transferase